MDTDNDIVKRALGYPYSRPLHSYLLKDGEISRLDRFDPDPCRIPVLACGSNAAPDQLQRKFAGLTSEEIPVTFARLNGFISAYSPHFSSYGSIPATLLPASEASTTCHITWLKSAQLDIMHETEAVGANYRYSKLSEIDLNCELTGHHSSIFAYIGRRGYLEIDGKPAILNEIPSVHKAEDFISLTQHAVQSITMNILTGGINLNRYISENTDKSIRQGRIEKLQKHRMSYPDFRETILLDKK